MMREQWRMMGSGCVRASVAELAEIGEILQPLNVVYPGFSGWFQDRVVTGVLRGTRRIIVHRDSAAIHGLAIVKREDEKKICTVWVAPDHRASGLGIRLMREALDWLGTRRPLFTVPQERLEEFRPILARLQFEPVAAVPSLYRTGFTEYVFNQPFCADSCVPDRRSGRDNYTRLLRPSVGPQALRVFA